MCLKIVLVSRRDLCGVMFVNWCVKWFALSLFVVAVCPLKFVVMLG